MSRFLKQQNPNVQIVLADPMGSALYSWVKTGQPTMSEGPSITEGIGNSRVTNNLLDTAIDDAVQVTDQEMGPGHTIVTILAGTGSKYQSRLFNPEFLREKGLSPEY